MKSYKFKAFKLRMLQKIFKIPLEVKKSWEETPSDFKEMKDFLNWFDSTDSVESTIMRANSDWNLRFVANPYFEKINKKVALEIGFGGGRLLTQSCKFFDSVYGVDIHHNFEMTAQFLESQNVKNFNLVKRDEIFKIPDDSIDFVYSFIVFQHFDKVEEVDFYLSQIKRLLTPHGVAHIYFGKNKSNDVSITSENEFRLRDCSLFIGPDFMRNKIAENFTLIDYKDELPRDPVTGSGESVQAMVIFKKK
jgi:ubiquinone/menaquinone biosynthesis C-methylase UbiE